MTLAKPEPWKRVKGRRKRQERKAMSAARAEAVPRDGYCRLEGCGLGPCSGPSQFAHFEDSRRFLTRGMAPEQRHDAGGGLVLCQQHHDRYDGRARPRIEIEAKGPARARGLLRFRSEGTTYEEVA